MTVGSLELSANKNITQQVHVCTPHDKWPLLKDILRTHKELKKILIFVQRKVDVDQLARSIEHEGWRVRSMHGENLNGIVINHYMNLKVAVHLF